jgi:hypothetical protein
MSEAGVGGADILCGEPSPQARGRVAMRKSWHVIIGAAVFLACAPAFAQDTTYDPDTFPFAHRFGLSLGGYFQIFNTKAGYSSENNPGEEVDLENESGLPRNRQNLRLEGYYRLGQRHRLDFGSYFWNRSATRTLDQDIEWQDVVYQVGASLSTSFDTQVYKVAYRYSLVQSESVELMVSGGFSAFSNQIEIAGEGKIIGADGQPVGEGTFERKRSSKVIPVPVVGLHCDYAFSRALILRGGVEYFTFSADTWNANLTDARVSLDWMPWDHWGFGAGYNYVELGGKVGNEDDRFRLTYSYDGAIAYVTMRY